MKRNKYFDKLLDKLPSAGGHVGRHNFLTIDTSGRIIIEDCDRIKNFTDNLLVVTQGRLSLTFTGEQLRLINLSRRGTLLAGTVHTVRLDRNEVKK